MDWWFDRWINRQVNKNTWILGSVFIMKITFKICFLSINFVDKKTFT